MFYYKAPLSVIINFRWSLNTFGPSIARAGAKTARNCFSKPSTRMRTSPWCSCQGSAGTCRQLRSGLSDSRGKGSPWLKLHQCRISTAQARSYRASVTMSVRKRKPSGFTVAIVTSPIDPRVDLHVLITQISTPQYRHPLDLYIIVSALILGAL